MQHILSRISICVKLFKRWWEKTKRNRKEKTISMEHCGGKEIKGKDGGGTLRWETHRILGRTQRIRMKNKYKQKCHFYVRKTIKLIPQYCIAHSLLPTILCDRLHVHNLRDFPQAKIDSKIKALFLPKEHGDLNFFIAQFWCSNYPF